MSFPEEEKGESRDAWAGAGEQCGHPSLKAKIQPKNQLQFGSTIPAADKSVLLLSNHGRLIQYLTPVAVARLLLVPLKNLR